MPFITWEDRFSVGVIIIDEQHKVLVDFTNRLFDACTSDDSAADEMFRKVIKDAVEYVKTHFSMEENLMVKYEYPYTVPHKKEHAKFIMKILEEAVTYEKQGRVAAISFVRFLKDWLLGHIALIDHKFGSYLNSKGVL